MILYTLTVEGKEVEIEAHSRVEAINTALHSRGYGVSFTMPLVDHAHQLGTALYDTHNTFISYLVPYGSIETRVEANKPITFN